MTPSSHQADDTIGRIAEHFTRAFRRMRSGVAVELAPLGVTFSQARVLRAISRAGEPVRVGDLAATLEMAPRSATGMVDALETAGLAQRRPDPVDRRSVRVALTPKGSDLLSHMAQARRAGAEELFGRLDDAQRAQLLELLETLNAPAEPASGPGEVR